MSIYEERDGYAVLTGARVSCIPIFFPDLKPLKTKLVFTVLCENKEYMCIVYGKTATRLCHHIDVGRKVNVYGKEMSTGKRPKVFVHTIMMPRLLDADALFVVVKPRMWNHISKIPIISRLLPEAMRV